MMRRWYWVRLAPSLAVLLAAFAAALWSWRANPPVRDLTGSARYMRNTPGDLGAVLVLFAAELSLVIMAMQPWRKFPRRLWIGLSGIVLGAWGVIRFLIGLHSAPVMLPHDLAMPVLCIVLCFSALAVPRTDASATGERAI